MTEKAGSRELILDILTEILEKGAYSHVVLGQALGKYQYLSKADRGLITRVTEGTLEYLIQIDWILNRYSAMKVEKMKPVIRTILRMSLYQILYMDRIPDSAACNEGVKLAERRKLSGLKGFVNGVLRKVSREKEGLLKELSSPDFPRPDIRFSVPGWLYRLWADELGKEQAEKGFAAFFQASPTTVRCNLSLASKEEITESLKAQGVSVLESPLSGKALMISGYDYLEGLDAFSKGWIQVQDASSILSGEAVPPPLGAYVLDICAAPGGKSLHMADMLKGTGMVEARDISMAKIQLIEENIRRTGFSNIRTKVWDGRVPDPEAVGQADILLADLPCSGLGIIGKKPDIKLQMTQEKLESLVKLQREILSVAWQYVKPGGVLSYSTCTVHRAENQGNAAWFQENYPFVQEKQLEFLPGRDGCDGFFVAVFRRER